MERRPTSILTTLAVSLLALMLIAPWALGQDPDRITEIRRQAEQGDADAQGLLGVMYATGDGVSEDDAEAIRWFRLAAEQGHARAQRNLRLDFAYPVAFVRVLGRLTPPSSRWATLSVYFCSNRVSTLIGVKRAWISVSNGPRPLVERGASHMHQAVHTAAFRRVGLLTFLEVHSRLESL